VIKKTNHEKHLQRKIEKRKRRKEKGEEKPCPPERLRHRSVSQATAEEPQGQRQEVRTTLIESMTIQLEQKTERMGKQHSWSEYY
jgi:hypothetical protein